MSEILVEESAGAESGKTLYSGRGQGVVTKWEGMVVSQPLSWPIKVYSPPRTRRSEPVKGRDIQDSEEWLDPVPKCIARLEWKAAQKEWLAQRDERKKRDRLSRAEVEDEIQRLVEVERKNNGLGKRVGESKEEWSRRIWGLNKRLMALWNANLGRITGGMQRYVEGIPARAEDCVPRIAPHTSLCSTGRGPCLNCEVRKMRCSRTVMVFGVDEDAPCQRCVRNNEACVDRCTWEVAGCKLDSAAGKGSKKSLQANSNCFHGMSKRTKWFSSGRVVPEPVPGHDSGQGSGEAAPSMVTIQRRDAGALRLATGLIAQREGIGIELVGSMMQEIEKRQFVLPVPTGEDRERVKKMMAGCGGE